MIYQTIKEAVSSEVFLDLLPILGARGVLRSAYYSHKYFGNLGQCLLHPNVIVDWSEDATFGGDGYLSVGLSRPGISHPELTKSKISVESGGTLNVTGDGRISSIGPGSVIHIEGSFSIGESSITADGRIICEEGIKIGDHCAISWDVTILDSDRHRHWQQGKLRNKAAPVVIGDNVWIGHGATITKGVHIGDGAIVASNSVVTHDVEENTLVAGIPAQPVVEDVSWESGWE